MADRRMFSKTITDTDAFLDMPLSAQALYFHLALHADDDGFVGNPKRIQKMINASDDDAKLLILKHFILTFESGVIVIKHWKIHNYIQSDRYKETTYNKEKSTLMLDDKKAYIECLDTDCIQNGYNSDTQVSIGKDSIEIEVSKKVSNKKENIQSYDEIFEDMYASEKLKAALIEFISYLKASYGIRVFNNRLANMLHRLDFKYGNDDLLKCQEVRRAIVNGYKRLECECEESA